MNAGWAAGALWLGAVAWAGIPEVPDTVGCRDRPPQMSCFTDADQKGTCVKKQVNTPDFSKPGPPTFEMKDQMVCVATAPRHELKDLVAFIVAALVVMGLVAYSVLRKKTLADY